MLFAYETNLEYARAAIEQAPPGLSTAAFIAWGLQLMARVRFEGLRDELRVIQSLIDSDQSLQERALRKREMLNGLIAEALLHRGLSTQQSLAWIRFDGHRVYAA